MDRTKMNIEEIYRVHFSRLAAIVVALVFIGCFPARSLAQQKGQKTFSSAEEASRALFAAVQADDEKAILDVLGPEGKQIVSSGDESEDAKHRVNFAQRYQEMHRLVKEPNGTTTLYIGAANYPTPIPLLENGGVWYFDTQAGKEEILFRRIGHNELAAIRVCEVLVAAQKEYYAEAHNTYAQKFRSDEGQRNGLYWAASGNQPESPVGPLVARASIEGGGASKKDANYAEPFHGYYFRILTRQGKGAPGGPADYVVDGKMSAGFAFVAFPAEYRNSGVMTFVVSKDGVVYEKDLGKKTAAVAKALKEYSPDPTWAKVEEQTEQSAAAQKPQ